MRQRQLFCAISELSQHIGQITLAMGSLYLTSSFWILNYKYVASKN